MSNTSFFMRAPARRANFRTMLGLSLGAALWLGAPAPQAQAEAAALTPIFGVTLAGSVKNAGGGALANARVALISKANLGSLALGNGGFRDTVTNSRGEFAFTGVAGGGYFVGPYVEGAIFRVTGTQVSAPVDLSLTASTGTLGLSFTQAGVDSSPPVLAITGLELKNKPAATGTLIDPVSGNPKTASGPLGVAASLYRTGGLVPNAYNFRTARFEVPTPASGQANPLLNPDYYRVAAVSAQVSIPVGSTGLTKGTQFTPTGAAFPTEVRASFSIALPVLPAGSYKLAMAGIDGSLRRSALVTREFTVGGVTPPAGNDTTAPSAAVTMVNTTSVSGGTATSPVSVSSLASVSGTAADAGSGVASVKLYVIRNLRRDGLISYKADFWNGSAFVEKTLTLGTSITSLPTVATTLDPTVGGASVKWSKVGGLPTTPGSYGLLAYAMDKSGNITKPTTLASFDDLTALQAAIRYVVLSSNQPA